MSVPLKTGKSAVPQNQRLAEDDFFAVANDAARGVARIDDQLRGMHDGFVVVAGMIGSNHHSIVTRESLWIEWHRLHVPVIVVAHLVELGEVWIVVIELRAALLEELHDFKRWRFTEII